MIQNAARIAIFVFSLLIEIPLGFAIWRITAFLRPELIHDKLMTLGDYPMSSFERTKIEAIWIPLGVFVAAFSWFQIRLLIDVVKKSKTSG